MISGYEKKKKIAELFTEAKKCSETLIK